MTPHDIELIEELGSYAYNPRGFVQWAFPWGEAGTELAAFREPYTWQIDYLEELGSRLRSGMPVQLATTSGHGTGKSALTGMETWFAFATFPGTRGVITANTENQLKTKTWVEIAKWHRLFIARHLFKCTATALFSADEEMAREWRMDIVPWSERNTEAFAGLHNAGKRLLIGFDEASAIPDIIWETTEGALTDTDTEIIWTVKGNPTRNSGRFRECFPGGRFAHRWSCREINSLEVPGTNKDQLQAWIKDYGEDSDFCRIRIFGRFPRNDVRSFISLESARAAVMRTPPSDNPFPVVLGVDVGRFGDDPSVIFPRQGPDARTRPPRVFPKLDTLQLAHEVGRAYNDFRATAIFVDEGGVGGGLVDILIDRGYPVYGVQFGGGADNSNPIDPATKYANKRAEIWGACREALRTNLCIPNEVRGSDTKLVDELTGPTYDYNMRDEIVLEAKKSMKARGVASPNVADALCLTFAYPSFTTPDAGITSDPVFDFNPYEDA